MLLKTKCITWKPKSPITRHSILLLYIPLLNKYFFLLIIIMIKIFFFSGNLKIIAELARASRAP